MKKLFLAALALFLSGCIEPTGLYRHRARIVLEWEGDGFQVYCDRSAGNLLYAIHGDGEYGIAVVPNGCQKSE